MRKPIAQLEYITRDAEKHILVKEVELACSGGVRWVQLRLKNRSEADIISIAKEVKAICKKYNSVFIINDYVNVSIEVDADGVHLGKSDMSFLGARKLLGDGKIIGGSTNSFEDILNLNDLDLDYVGLGPFRFTTTKENLNPLLGEEGIQHVMKQVKNNNIQIPIIAIGGIQLGDVASLINYGVHGVAVSSAISDSENIEIEARKFVNACSIKSAVVEQMAN